MFQFFFASLYFFNLKRHSRFNFLNNYFIFFGLFILPTQVSAFDFARGNAAASIIQPQVVDAVRTDFSSGGSDPSTVLRVFVLNSNGMYDAIAPYHPTAVGVYSRLGRRPASESADNIRVNVAILYASHQVLTHLFPARAKQWDKMLQDLGLDPFDASEDLNSPIGIGNRAGKGVVEGRAHDGLNALGDEGGRRFNLLPYSDYSGYEPVNTAYKLVDPSRWQPRIVKGRNGIYQVQQFVTPQYRFVEPYSYKDPSKFGLPSPINSDYRNKDLYIAQARQILEESASLDDRKMMLAEYFDDKIKSLGGSGVYLSIQQNLGLIDSVISNFFTNVAAYDAGIVVWQEKVKYDAVRPFSAINFLFKGQIVRAYLGPASTKAGEIPGEEWASYTPTADHAEYPSGSACFCAAHAEFKRKYYGSDNLGYKVQFPAGSSRIEPAVTPRSDLAVNFSTWTEFAQLCGQSRVWAGVHFQSAVDESLKLCPVFGDMAYDYMQGLVSGTTELRGPSHSTRK